MFGISTDGLRVIHNYDLAKGHFNSITPIRGTDVRPIGKRSKRHMQITEGRNEHGHYYAAKLYNTECVRWYEDDRMQVRCGGWSSVSTATFIHAVAPLTCCIQDNYVRVRGIRMANNDTGLWFAKGEHGWECANMPRCYIEKFNRKETTRLRNLPAVPHIQTYLTSMKALGAYANPNPAAFGFSFKSDDLLIALLKYNGEPPMDMLANFGEAVRGQMSSEMLYRVCLKAGLTIYEVLYDREYVPADSPKRGVKCV